MSAPKWIGYKAGMPVDSDFSGTAGLGSPVIVDTTTDIAYYVHPDTHVITPLASGGGTPAGSDYQVQYNNAGAFGADASFTWSYGTQVLTIGSIGAPGQIVGGSTNTLHGEDLRVYGGSGNTGSGTHYGGYLTVGGGLGSLGGDARLWGGQGYAGKGGDSVVRGGDGVGRGGDVKIRGGDGSGGGGYKGNVYANGVGAALATTAVGGFFEIPTVAGTPTGTPTQSLTGNAPLQYDTAANKLWVYNGSWRSVTLT